MSCDEAAEDDGGIDEDKEDPRAKVEGVETTVVEEEQDALLDEHIKCLLSST